MSDNNFSALPPVATSIVVNDETIDITPIKIGELPAFSRAVQPIAAHLSASPDWLALIAEHGDALIEALTIAARRPRDWVAELELDDAVKLASTVFEVNADFFIQRLLPSVMEAAARLETRMAGRMPSSN
ncbi:DUF6631 family protein [Nitrosomonas communis]|uniref:Uncharacterized protein n=1 Tax=Nitrosomonas communis TaxID=44574 RepID=A0A1I4LQY5_9PROT|nr:DUF6631 family protein [Nitrosomonas communis]SFL93301.1 hypothetical protein SAMN05421863_100751 [Nitrosomonas communis]